MPRDGLHAEEALLQVAQELEDHAVTLREQISLPRPVPIRNAPRAPLELTEDELRYGIDVIPDTDIGERPEAVRLLNKLMHALAVESGPGGNFDGGDIA